MLNVLKRLRIRGGVHAEEHKADTAMLPICRAFPTPKKLYIPLQQHVGKPAEPSVKVGDQVLKGQLLAYSQGMISAPVHAPSSGTILDITDFPAPHPSALPIRTIILETDGNDTWQQLAAVDDPFALDPEDISLRVGAAGIVGLGGATFPSAVKLSLGRKNKIHTLLINGGECEPYLSCDDRIMQEHAHQIIDGVRIMLHGMETNQAIIAIEDNKAEAYAAMRNASADFAQISVIQVPTRYPMGWDRQLIRYIIGKEVPAESRSTDVGVTMHNVATTYAIHKAVRYGQPLLSKVLTVSGDAVGTAMNVEVPIGTLISDILAFCQVDLERTARVVMGGPMMGEAVPHVNLPIVKATSAILAFTDANIKLTQEQPCIRCASCVDACPAGLLPLQMVSQIRANKLDAAVAIGLKDCISCGSCSYVCPSNIPLVHYFKYATGELMSRVQAKHKDEQTRRLIEDKNQRLQRIKLQQEEEAARRKAEREARARKKAEAEQAKAQELV